MTEEDEHDSSLIGTVMRCRAHILAVAPEMQTVDAIAYGDTQPFRHTAGA